MIHIKEGEKIIFDPNLHYSNYISNSPTFLRGSLLDNITLLDPSIDHSKIVAALELSKLNKYPSITSSSFSIQFGADHLNEEIKSRILLARIYASPHRIIIIDDFDFAIEEQDYENFFEWLIQTNKLLIFSSQYDFGNYDQIQQLPIKS